MHNNQLLFSSESQQMVTPHLQISTRTTRTPVFWEYPQCSMITHYWFTSDNKNKMRHTLLSCLIILITMKWIQRVLFKTLSRHILSSDGWTDAQTDERNEFLIPHFQLRLKRAYDKLALLLLSKNIIVAHWVSIEKLARINGENILKTTISWP